MCQTFSAKLRVTEKSTKGSDSSCPGMSAMAAATVSCMQYMTAPLEVLRLTIRFAINT